MMKALLKERKAQGYKLGGYKQACRSGQVTDVDQDLVTSVQNATGISQISFLVYEQPEFVDKASGVRSLSDILQIAITVLIFALLGFVVFKSTRSSEEEPK